MTAITIHTENTDDIKLFEQLAKRLNVSIKIEGASKESYKQDWEEMMTVSESEAKDDKLTSIESNDLWK